MPLDSEGYESIRRVSCLVSQCTISKDRPKLTCNDYEFLKETADYEEALHTYANISSIPAAEYLSTSEYDEVPNSDSTDEEIYIDPGHSEADICTCFKTKKDYLIDKSDIR